MKNSDHLSNKEKALIYAKLCDAFNDNTKLQESIKWLNEVYYQLDRMRDTIDREIDWNAIKGEEC